jgi:hypothetical protein
LYQKIYTFTTQDHEYVYLKVVKLLSRVFALCEEETCNYACPFVHFHIKASIARHVELQNVVGTLITRTGTGNFCSPK